MLILYRLWFTDNRLRWIFHLRIPVGAYIGFRFFDLNNTNIGFGLPWLDYSGILALGISLQTPILTTPISRQPKYPPHTHPNMIYIYITCHLQHTIHTVKQTMRNTSSIELFFTIPCTQASDGMPDIAKSSENASKEGNGEKKIPAQDQMQSRLRAVQLTGGKLPFGSRWEIYEATSCNVQCRARDGQGKQLTVAGPPDKLMDAQKMAIDIMSQQEGFKLTEVEVQGVREENKEGAKKKTFDNRGWQRGNGRAHRQQHQPWQKHHDMQPWEEPSHQVQPSNFGRKAQYAYKSDAYNVETRFI